MLILEKILNSLDKFIVKVSYLTGALCFVLIGVVVLFNIFGRFVAPSFLHGLIEMMEFLLVAAVFFSLSFSQLTGGHVRMETLISRLPEGGQCGLNILTSFLLTIMGGVLCWQIGHVAYASWISQDSVHSTTFNLPYWPRDLLALLGSVLLLLSFTTQTCRNLIGLLKGNVVVGFNTWEK